MPTIGIPLRNRSGAVVARTLVDSDLAEHLNQWTWRLHRAPSGKLYAVRRERGLAVFMHREVLGLPRNGRMIEADHISGDGLDNRRTNLRAATHAQNRQNTAAHRGATSHYRGVYWDARDQRWIAQVKIGGRKIIAGRFLDEEQAALAASLVRERVMPFTNKARM